MTRANLLKREKMLKELEEERPIQDWVVKLQKKARKERLNELGKIGLI